MTDLRVCSNPNDCCRELSRVWQALEGRVIRGKSASENVAALLDELVHALQAEAPPNQPVFCAHCSTTMYHCPVCGKTEWRAGAAESELEEARAQDAGTTRRDWRPIETAPKDGEGVILATKDGAVGEARWTDEAWYWAGNDPTDSWGRPVYENEAAAWMPLPHPPLVNAGATPPAQGKAESAQNSVRSLTFTAPSEPT